ncbi:glycosyltransferase [Butyrivibrio sp.]|uniref:glycosyltransferase n=1 Tax=Butyrivibrio sp. TaxID=28121 RepID=UPI0025C44BB4|nr:glycosyltransferase [Butyrivibrio sp.]MBE5839554.1 glycosyltransferase [Butyrivibrio sp.]
MRVLWLAVVPALYDESKVGGWIGALEQIVCNYNKNIELGIMFEHEDQIFKINKDGVDYYPIHINKRKVYKLNPYKKWKKLRNKMLRVIEDFKPDIIHCFGSEWPYGLITNDIEIPVVLHMQGFLNTYIEMESLVFDENDARYVYGLRFDMILKWLVNRKENAIKMQMERHIMRINRYYMGRTKWDSNIVKYYSPDSIYYYCPEAIRPQIYNASKTWNYIRRQRMSIVTISQANSLKGNEIILRTAKFLKEVLKVDFEWKVAGKRNIFQLFEKKTKINHRDVNIKLLGMIDANNVVEQLVDSDIYVHPAVIDNSPNSLCEAQLIGCPVVAANVGGIPQLVDDGESGILYPYNEFQTLAYILVDLYSDKELMIKLSKNEYTISHKRHSPEFISNVLEDIYTDVIVKSNI